MVIVGPCTSGKSTLARALVARGYDARSLAQEHSSIRRMHLRHDPDVLVYLDVSYPEIRLRRPISWGPDRLKRAKERLAPAREDAHLYVHTDGKGPGRVLEEVLEYLEGGARRAKPTRGSA